MKKFLFFLFILSVFAVPLIACGTEKSNSEPSSESESESASESESESASESASESESESASESESESASESASESESESASECDAVPGGPADIPSIKKITFLGDSITAGVGTSSREKRYATLVSNFFGNVENNMGINGTVLCTGGHRTSRLGDVKKIPIDSDVVSVLLGVNDFDQCKNSDNSVYYTLGDMESADTTTIYGALHAYCQELKARLDEEKTMIFFMTPVITSWNQSVSNIRDWDQNKKNACGYTLRQLCDAIVEVCDYYDILCFDLNAKSGLVQSDFADGIHPNDAGMEKIANAIQEFIIENYQE